MTHPTDTKIGHIELAYIVCSLPEKTKLLNAMEDILQVGPNYGKARYRSQKDHWMGWLADHANSGAYGRKNPKKSSAKFIFNAIGCSPMLFWLCEAIGIAENQVDEAFMAVTQGELLPIARNMRSQCAAIRRVIPWSDVEHALKKISSIPLTKQKKYDVLLEEARQYNQVI